MGSKHENNPMKRIILLALTVSLCGLARGQSDAVLPVRSVTLFSSGVSYTQREGEVTGDATIPLTFRTAQVNDLLKSMVLLDERGKVQPAIYGAKDPIGRTLAGYAIDVSQISGMADLLGRLRGMEAKVKTEKTTLTGRVLGVEQRKVALGQSVAEVPFVTLAGAEGIQALRLDDIQSLQLADPKRQKEFSDALALLATGADDNRRTITLGFSGEGRRKVKVGYVSEAPLWKVSYRLMLGGPAAQSASKSYLQGWAHVENTTDEDWNGVKLSLVSGRPVSFIQDLYQPLYLPRPIIGPDIQAAPLPQLSESNMEDEKLRDAVLKKSVASARSAAMPNSALGRGAGGFGGGGGAFGGRAPEAESNAPIALGKTVESMAEGGQAGELFAYSVGTPLSLPRQQAAMIPIVSGDVTTEKVSVYNADSIGPTFPMNAVKIVNDTGLYLKGGPLTLFDDGTYAGDARMLDVPPGDSRFVTYALDLSVQGERQNLAGTTTETGISIRRGVLTVNRKARTETKYTFKNKAEKPRILVVEHPYDAQFTLAAPAKADERTASLYRFRLTVPAGKSESLTVATERPLSQTVALLEGDMNFILFYTERKEGTPAKLKAALDEVVTRRRKLDELKSKQTEADGELESLTEDQDRVRKNMAALDKTSALYKRYVAQLDEQETKIQALRVEKTRLTGASAESQRSLRAFLDTLEIGG